MSLNETLESIDSIAKQRINEIHTAMPAVIVSFNPQTCTASVKPSLNYHVVDGRTLEYPIIVNVPVFMPKAGNSQITYPVKSGDNCLLVFCERCTNEWIGKGVYDERKFDLTDAFAFVGMCPSQSINPNHVEVINGSTKLSVEESGTVRIEGTLIVSGDVIGGGISLIGHTHPYHHGSTGPSQ